MFSGPLDKIAFLQIISSQSKNADWKKNYLQQRSCCSVLFSPSQCIFASFSFYTLFDMLNVHSLRSFKEGREAEARVGEE